MRLTKRGYGPVAIPIRFCTRSRSSPMDSIFSQVDGGPLCTPEMGGDYRGHNPGDFPISEQVCSQLVFLPVLSNPVADAADQVIAAIRKVAHTLKHLPPNTLKPRIKGYYLTQVAPDSKNT